MMRTPGSVIRMISFAADHPAIAAARPPGGKIDRARGLVIGARTCLPKLSVVKNI
jgi:hypothetical protein